MLRGAKYGLHEHDFYELMLITKGAVREMKSGNRFGEWDLHLLPKGRKHGFEALEDVYMKITCSKKPLPKSLKIFID